MSETSEVLQTLTCLRRIQNQLLHSSKTAPPQLQKDRNACQATSKERNHFIKLPSQSFMALCALGSATCGGRLQWQAATPHLGPSRMGPRTAGIGLRWCWGAAGAPRAQLSWKRVLEGIISSPFLHSDIVHNITAHHKVKWNTIIDGESFYGEKKKTNVSRWSFSRRWISKPLRGFIVLLCLFHPGK